MTVQTLLELLIGEIDLRGDKLIIWLGWFQLPWSHFHRSDDCLKVSQHILFRRLNGCLLSFIVEAVTAILQLSWFDASVWTVWNHWSTLHEERTTDTSHVKTCLLSRCPAQEETVMQSPHGMQPTSVPSHTAILTDTNPIAVKSHGNTSVGITSVYEVPWNVKVIADKCRKGVVGILVGIIRTPVCHGFHLLGRDGIGEKRRVMPLNCQLEAIALTDDVRLHTIPSEDVLQLWRQIASQW